MTIRQYGELDRTGDLSLLKKWYNPLPVRIFKIDKFFQEVAIGLKSDSDAKLFHEVGKVLSLNKLMMLEVLYYAIYNCIVLKASNDQWGVTEHKKTNFIEYRDKIKHLTGIEIKTPDDITNLKKEIERLTDKYNERYKDEPEDTKSVPFIEYSYSIFMIVEMDYNPDMRLSEFFNLITTASNRLKQIEKIKNGRNN